MLKKSNVVEFETEDGIKLHGILYEAKFKTNKVIISIHGMGSNCFKERETAIAEQANEVGIDYFCFNNRGSELVKYLIKADKNKKEKLLGGTSYEDVLDSYYDIVGAIVQCKKMGYQAIYLQGHSLGCTKIVYTYNRLKSEKKEDILSCIRGIVLLSLIDIPTTVKIFLDNKAENYIGLAENKVSNNQGYSLMPEDAFINPISAKTFLRYVKNNKDIDVAHYEKDDDLKFLNQIEVPLYMRWGNQNEMIVQSVEELVNLAREKLKNKYIDVNYIDGANHSYTDREEIVAKQIIQFLLKVEKNL